MAMIMAQRNAIKTISGIGSNLSTSAQVKTSPPKLVSPKLSTSIKTNPPSKPTPKPVTTSPTTTIALKK